MDPYVEQLWGDFSIRFIVYLRDRLQKALPHDLIARIDSWVGVRPRHTRVRYVEPPTGRSIVVRELDSYRSVTTILWTYPFDRQSRRGHESYRSRRDKETAAGASLVEFDLFRSGKPVDDELTSPRASASDYEIRVRRAWQADAFDSYAIPARKRLPVISIPFRCTDPEVPFDVQEFFDFVYEKGYYGYDIDYRKAPRPPFRGEDAEWADALLRQQGRR
jgi:hypothetical protein